MKTESLMSDFWQGKRVLVTGHTGFKGGWLCIWLNQLGAQVTGISLEPTTDPNLFDQANISELCNSQFCDIRNAEELITLVRKARPEIIFHLAAQPLVRLSYHEPIATFSTNIMGTAHVLEALRGLDSVRAVVLATTDKVYKNNEWNWPYREDDILGGYDPYSASKAASELVISSYRDAYLAQQGIGVASARAGNVIGGGDWSPERLIPDAVRSWQEKETLVVRSPNAVRPWQHVLEPLAGYLTLAEKLWLEPKIAGAYNFGPDSPQCASVRDVIQMARKAYGDSKVDYLNKSEGPHEANFLALEVSKAQQILGVKSFLSITESIERTTAWYKCLQLDRNARNLCEQDIAWYEECRRLVQ